MYFRKNIDSHQLDVQEANFSVSQFYRIKSYYFGCWFANWRTPCSWSMGCGDRSVSFLEEYKVTNKETFRVIPTPSSKKRKPRCWWTVKCGSRCHKRKFFSMWNDHQLQKSNDETHIQNPQSCVWWVDWQDQFGAENPHQILWHQGPTCGHVDQRLFHAWWLEPSSSFVQHHEFLDVFLAPICFRRELRKGRPKKDRRQRTQVSVFDFNKPEQRVILFLWSECFQYLGNPQLDSGFVNGAPRDSGKEEDLSWAQSKPLLKIGALRLCREINSWVGMFFSWAQGNLRGTGSRTQQRILQSGKKMIILFLGTRKLVRSGVCERSVGTGKLVRGIEKQLARTKLDYHNMQISGNQYLEKVSKNLRQKLKLSEDAPILNEKTNVLIWWLFVSTTMNASVGPNYNDNLFAYGNTNFEELKTLFDTTQRLILNHEFEIPIVSTIVWTFSPWMRSTLLHDKVIKWAKAKVHVYWDAVLCRGKMYEHPEANARWKDQFQDFQQSNAHRE